MIILVRHGERADDITNNPIPIELSFDPQLTEVGIQQAIQTGIYLNQYLQANEVNKVVVVTSPYLRCVQTTTKIVEQLRIPLVNDSILVSQGLGECFREDWFNRDILTELTIYSKEYQSNQSKYKLTSVPYNEVIQEYPEEIQSFFGRFSVNYRRLRNHYKDNVVIVVTHGYGVHCINTLERQIGNGHVEYCSLSIIKYQQSKKRGEYLLKNSILHLSKL